MSAAPKPIEAGGWVEVFGLTLGFRLLAHSTELILDEVDLLRRIAQQEQAALAELYDRYAQVLYSFAFKSLNSAEESEEVVLDVFAQVWRTADRYDSAKSQVSTWLFMMTRSRILDRLRRLQRTSRVAIAAESATEIQLPMPSVDPIENALLDEQQTQITLALAQLPPPQRQVIELAYFQGFTQSEIATQLNLSLGTVKTRIRLGLNKLRLALASQVQR